MSESRRNCAVCGKSESETELKSCAKCLSTSYCSRECQKRNWKTHKSICISAVPASTASRGPPLQVSHTTQADQLCYEVRSVLGKGDGLVAIRRLPRGTRILSERPLFLVPRDAGSLHVANDAVLKKLRLLSDHQRKAFHRLHNNHVNEKNSAIGIVRTNALPLGAGADQGGLFLQAARINHACTSNAQNTWNSETKQLTVHACRDIEKEEEICISYLDGFEKYTSRQQKLKSDFGFNCTCMLCSLPGTQREQSDTRIEELARLDSIVGDGMSIITAPLACLSHLQTMIRFMEEEEIADGRIPRAYYNALQIAIAHRDQKRAKVFAKRAYHHRLLLEGDDSPETRRSKELMERPSTHRLYGTRMKWRQGLRRVPEGISAEEFEIWLWKRKSS